MFNWFTGFRLPTVKQRLAEIETSKPLESLASGLRDVQDKLHILDSLASDVSTLGVALRDIQGTLQRIEQRLEEPVEQRAGSEVAAVDRSLLMMRHFIENSEVTCKNV